MKPDGKSRRMRERLELAIPVRVHCRESLEHEWVEMSRLIDVTPFGARFAISRPTEPGRLLYLTLPMPRQLRCFDHVEPQYRVWSLVRNVRAVAADASAVPRFEVGVAFIGKRPPASYETDPSRRYEVSKTTGELGLWALLEREGRELTRFPSSDERSETRHHMPIDVTVELFDEKGGVAASETTVTENVSRRGAAVFTTLDIGAGRFVRLTSKQFQLSVVAAVRARRVGADGIVRLHLEFVGEQWPID